MEELHHRLYKALAEHWADISEDLLKNQVLFTQALVFSPDCILSNLATELVVDGQRESLIQRLRSWLRIAFLDHLRTNETFTILPQAFFGKIPL